MTGTVERTVAGLRGEERVVVRYRGMPAGLTYLLPYVQDTLFTGDAQDTAQDAMAAPDLSFTTTRPGPGRPSVRMPFRVHMVADLSGGARALLSRNRRRAHAQRVRRHAYTYRVSHDPAEFLDFYDRFYLPTMTARHGGRARTVDRETALSTVFSRGMLLMVDAGGEPVAGIACQTAPGVLHSRLGGVLGGDERLWRDGASQVADLFLYDWAAAAGYATVDLQGCEPFLRKGSLQGKITLGAEVVPSPLAGHQGHVYLSVHRDSPAIRDYLAGNPVLAYDDRDRLGLAVFHDAGRSPERDLPRPKRGLQFTEEIDLDDFLAPLPVKGGPGPAEG